MEKKERKFTYLTEKELKAKEDEINELSLENPIKIKGKIIKTYGELRPYIKSRKIIEKLINFLEDREYCYFYTWFLDKELK